MGNSKKLLAAGIVRDLEFHYYYDLVDYLDALDKRKKED